MTTRSSNIIVLIIFGGYIVFRTFFPSILNSSIGDIFFSISIEIFACLFLLVLLQFFQNINRLKFFFLTQFRFRKKEIRLSISYLFRININGKYLLVKSRLHDHFQPVGGAFKTLPGSEKIFEKLDVRPDRLIETEHGIAKGDLRVNVKGVNVIEFLNWYNSKEDRETSPWREFCEELIAPGILPWQQFRYIDYKFRGTVRSPIITLDTGSKGMFIFEIYDLVPNNEQILVLKNLQENGNTVNHIWVNNYLIQRLGHDESTKTQIHAIAPHTKYAQNLKWSNQKTN